MQTAQIQTSMSVEPFSVCGKVFDLLQLVSLCHQRGLTHVQQAKLVYVDVTRILHPYIILH